MGFKIPFTDIELFQDTPETPQEDTAKESEPKNKGEIGYARSEMYGRGDVEKYDPDDLKIKKGNAVYQKMLTDDQVKPVIQFKKDAVTSRDYYFDVATDDDGDPREDHQEMADFFNFMIGHIRGSFTDNLKGILTAIENGFSISEKIYETIRYEDKAMWGLRDIKLRPFDSFEGGFVSDEHGNITKLKQSVPGQEIDIPLDKIIHFVNDPDWDTLYGRSDLRACYRSWFSKDIAIRFQNIFLERHASGFIWAQVEGSLEPQQKTALEALLRNINTSTGIHVPKNVDLNVENPAITTAFEDAISQHDKAIAKSVLVPNLLGITEQGNTGSYSQSEIQLRAFFWTLGALAKRLEEVLDEQLFRQLALWNFGTEDYPKFKFQPMTLEEALALSAAWGDLVQKGAVNNSETDEAYIRNLLGFPEAAEEEEPEDEEIPDEEEEPPEDQEEEEKPPEEFAEKTEWFKRVAFQQIERVLDENDESFLEPLSNEMAQARFKIEEQIRRVSKGRSFGNIKAAEFEVGVNFPKPVHTAIVKTSRTSLQETMEDGVVSAKRELPKHNNSDVYMFQLDTKSRAASFLSSRAMQIGKDLDADTMKSVMNVLRNGIKYDWSITQVMDALASDAKLTELWPDYEVVEIKGKKVARAINKPARLATLVRTTNSEAFNEARDAFFKSPENKGFVLAYEYSAILDDRTTEICRALDGRIRRDFANYTPPNHFNCRSLLIPVTAIDDWDGKEDPLPSIQPQEGFG
jgi:SPP1 gp7 family putative phage head morphogenesis protein